MPPKCLEYLLILCFENGVPNKILLIAQSQKFCPLQIFGLATPLTVDKIFLMHGRH